jgi:hypothetical protein
MPEQYLIVSNPPHGSIVLQPAADSLGLAVADFRMKTNFPAPEIWSAHSDLSSAQQQARTLLESGLRVALIPATVLGRVPPAHPAETVSFGEDGFSIVTSTGVIKVEKTERTVVIVCETMAPEGRVTQSKKSFLTDKVDKRGPLDSLGAFAGGVAGVAAYTAADKLDEIRDETKEDLRKQIGAIGETPTASLSLDIYNYSANGWQCARVSAQQTDFSGLGTLKQPTGRANIQSILESCRKDCDDACIDERLMKVSYRTTTLGGVALSKILGNVSQLLAVLPPMDLASRLAFMTSK